MGIGEQEIPKMKEVLKKHCPSMDDLFLDKQGRLFRDNILKAMNEYAHYRLIEYVDSRKGN